LHKIYGGVGTLIDALRLLESKKYNLGMGSEAQRWAPRAGAPIGEDEHPAEAIQAMDIGTINPRRPPGAWRELPAVRVAANLKRNSLFLGDGQPVRRVHQQDTCPVGLDAGAAQDGAEMPRLRRFAVMHPNDLQAVKLDFLVIHHAHSGFRDGFQILAAAGESFMISGYEKRPVRYRECGPGRSQLVDI